MHEMPRVFPIGRIGRHDALILAAGGRSRWEFLASARVCQKGLSQQRRKWLIGIVASER